MFLRSLPTLTRMLFRQNSVTPLQDIPTDGGTEYHFPIACPQLGIKTQGEFVPVPKWYKS
jgi:hypothetical protein